jgi:hypothetical protein
MGGSSDQVEEMRGPKVPRRVRTASESLLSIVLALEAFLIFFATLVVFALGDLNAATALVGGAVLLLVLALTGRFVRYHWGVWLGWLLQLVILATGFLTPLMFFIGAMFVAMWVYCFITGRRLDRRNAAASEPTAQSEENP